MGHFYLPGDTTIRKLALIILDLRSEFFNLGMQLLVVVAYVLVNKADALITMLTLSSSLVFLHLFCVALKMFMSA